MSYSDEKSSGYYDTDHKLSRSYEDQSYLERDEERYVIMSSSSRYDHKLSSSNNSSNSSFNNHSFSPKIPKGMTLDLSLAAEAKQTRTDSEPEIQEEALTIVFDLPDGSQGENNFKLGHTVEFVKSFVESEYGIPMIDQTLYLDDKVLQNPFSLLDYPEVKGNILKYLLFVFVVIIISLLIGCDEVYVRVEGHLPQHSRK